MFIGDAKGAVADILTDGNNPVSFDINRINAFFQFVFAGACPFGPRRQRIQVGLLR